MQLRFLFFPRCAVLRRCFLCSVLRRKAPDGSDLLAPEVIDDVCFAFSLSICTKGRPLRPSSSVDRSLSLSLSLSIIMVTRLRAALNIHHSQRNFTHCCSLDGHYCLLASWACFEGTQFENKTNNCENKRFEGRA